MLAAGGFTGRGLWCVPALKLSFLEERSSGLGLSFLGERSSGLGLSFFGGAFQWVRVILLGGAFQWVRSVGTLLWYAPLVRSFGTLLSWVISMTQGNYNVKLKACF